MSRGRDARVELLAGLHRGLESVLAWVTPGAEQRAVGSLRNALLERRLAAEVWIALDMARPTYGDLRAASLLCAETDGDVRIMRDALAPRFAHRIEPNWDRILPLLGAVVESATKDSLLTLGWRLRDGRATNLAKAFAPEELPGQLAEIIAPSTDSNPSPVSAIQIIAPDMLPQVAPAGGGDDSLSPIRAIEIVAPELLPGYGPPPSPAPPPPQTVTLQDLWRNYPDAFDRLFPSVRDVTMRYLGRSMGEVHARRLADMLARAVDRRDPRNIEAIVKRLRRRYPDMTRYRAVTIARTEMNRIYQQVEYRIYEENGIVARRWLTAAGTPTARRSGVCDNCLRNAAQGWVPLSRPFQSGHMHPPAHPRCRCDTLPDVLGDQYDRPPWPLGKKIVPRLVGLG